MLEGEKIAIPPDVDDESRSRSEMREKILFSHARKGADVVIIRVMTGSYKYVR